MYGGRRGIGRYYLYNVGRYTSVCNLPTLLFYPSYMALALLTFIKSFSGILSQNKIIAIATQLKIIFRIIKSKQARKKILEV